VASQRSKYVVATITAYLLGKTVHTPFRYAHHGDMTTIGRKSAVADFGYVKYRAILLGYCGASPTSIF